MAQRALFEVGVRDQLPAFAELTESVDSIGVVVGFRTNDLDKTLDTLNVSEGNGSPA